MRRRARQHPRDLALVALVFAVALATRPKRSAAMVSGPKMTWAEGRELARSVGFPDATLNVAASIMIAESGGYVWAQGDPQGQYGPTPNGTSTSFGLWQINAPSHHEYDPSRLLESDYNARAAFMLSKGGTDFTPWTTYRNGAYKAHMPPEDTA